MEKRICPKCNRVLQLSTHNNCMYCGEEIPEHLKLSSSEKDELEKEKVQAHKKMKNSKRKFSSDSMSLYSAYNTGFDIGSGF